MYQPEGLRSKHIVRESEMKARNMEEGWKTYETGRGLCEYVRACTE